MTEAPQNAPCVAASAPEPQADQIQYLTPTPPGFAPEYDYLALLESISDIPDSARAGSSDASPRQAMKDLTRLRLYSGVFGALRQARLINSFGLTEWEWKRNDDPRREVEYMYGQIQDMRQKLTLGPPSGDRILMVDEPDDAMLQVLGAATDLDPTFLWRHYNVELDSSLYVPEMTRLRHAFLARVASNKRGTANIHADHYTAISAKDPLHIRGRLEGRMLEHKDSSHISFCRISESSWLILISQDAHHVDASKHIHPKPFSLMFWFGDDPGQGAHLPSIVKPTGLLLVERKRKKIVRANFVNNFSTYYNGANVFTSICDLLTSKSPIFRSRRDEEPWISELLIVLRSHDESGAPNSFRIILSWLVAVSVWRNHIRSYDRTLEELSARALRKPSLEAFRPIPSLRKNVMYMGDAIERAKDGIGAADMAAFAELQRTVGFPLKSLDSIFQTLLQQTDALSAKASNEIQLVLGSITVQDSDMMKRQSRRATFLTLLAAFYLPLTLVTGIFGMNIKEFDGENAPPLYLCFEALFAVVAVTVIFFGLYRYLPLVFLTLHRRKTRPGKKPFRLHWTLLVIGKIISAPFRQIYHAFLSLEERRQNLYKEPDLPEGVYDVS